MRREHGAAWVITQFFAVSLAQHGMLVGLTLPLQPAMAADGAPLGPLDAVACAVCAAGILIGCVADNQLRAYGPRTIYSFNTILLLLWRCAGHSARCWHRYMLTPHPKPLVLETGEMPHRFVDLLSPRVEKEGEGGN